MSKFQQRHYEAIARVMQDAAPEAHWDANKKAQWDVTISRMIDMFRRDNCDFMPVHFERACQPGANIKARTR